MIPLGENDAIRLFIYIHSMKHKILLFLFAALMMCQCVSSLRADVHYIAVASDRHGPETDAERAASPTAQRSVVLGLTGITNKVEYVCLDGDMVGSKGGSDPRNAPPYNSSEVMTEVNYLFPDLTNANVAIVYADHDGGCTDDVGIMKCNDGNTPNTTGQSQLIYTGKTAAGKVAYYVYGVSFASMYGTGNACNGDADGPARFKAWVDTTDSSVPIIVASHVPLHYRRGDNVGAVAWSKALNYAATGSESVQTGQTVKRNVIFLHGHIHTAEGTNNPYEYYLPVGSKMIVGKTYDTSNSHVIYYTYTTAGYLRDRHASTLIKIDGKNVTVSKYVEGSLKKEEAYRGSAFKEYYYSQTFASSGFVTTSPNVIDRTSPALAFQNEGCGNESEIEGHKGRIYDVTLNGRTLYKDGHWNTLCLPFDVDLTDRTSPLFGATAQTLTGASFDANTGELALNFEKTTGTSRNHWEVKDYMYAGTPYLVKWNPETPSTIENPTFYGVTVSTGVNPVVMQQDGEDLIEFKGIFESITFAEEDRSALYLGDNDYLYYPSPATGQEVKIGAFRAYFQLKGDLKAQAASSNGVKAFRLNFGEDETTSIRLVNSSSVDEKGSDCYYMLDGRRLNGRPTEKGIYILNGKKIVIHLFSLSYQ